MDPISSVTAAQVSPYGPTGRVRPQAAPEEPQRDREARDSQSAETGLTEAEQREVEKLRQRDREVRAHEQAHLAAAGELAQGGATYTYQRGPDQQQYAVAGEVRVDTSEVPGDPAATLRKAEKIRRAALAPVNPSAQDRAAAAEASRMAAEARAELLAENAESRTAAAGDAASSEGNTELAEGQGTCPACGGAHAAHAHDGMTAYAAQSGPDAAPASSLIASV